MADSRDLIEAIRIELKAAGVTYAELASRLGTSESTVKRMFSRGDMSLSRVDEILAALQLDFSDLARHVTQSRPETIELSEAQERDLVKDRKLMMVALSCQSEWRFEQMLQYYRISETELISCMTQLDKLGVIELRANNRYTLKLAKGFRWLPHGPVMRYFREKAMNDYFSTGFDGPGEMLLLAHGTIAVSAVPGFNDRLQRLVDDFSRQHLADQALGDEHKRFYTLVLGMRQWIYEGFEDLVVIESAQ